MNFTVVKQQEFVDYVVDLMQSMGPVYSKKMFGGYGLFLDGLMFALIADCDLYLKVDQENKAEFEAQGLQPFRYQKKDRTIQMSYHQAPEEVMEDFTAMNVWGNSAYKAALRSIKVKK
ncbi:MAG: TfoX/Sxy family protein [Cellvibrionaceae bacterium]